MISAQQITAIPDAATPFARAAAQRDSGSSSLRLTWAPWAILSVAALSSWARGVFGDAPIAGRASPSEGPVVPPLPSLGIQPG